MTKDILFISGTARSGTTAMANMLNDQSGFLIGVERYNRLFRAGEVTPGHFAPPRFLDIRPGDSHKKGGFPGIGDPGARLSAASVIGDKFPQLYQHYDAIFARFPRARHIFMIRNPLSVAESYQARAQNPRDNWQRDFITAVTDWNQSLAAVLALTRAQRGQVFIAEYEKVFFEPGEMRRLFVFLNRPFDSTRAQKTFARAAKLSDKMVPRRDDIRLYVSQNADWASYGRLCRSAGCPVSRAPPAPSP